MALVSNLVLNCYKYSEFAIRFFVWSSNCRLSCPYLLCLLRFSRTPHNRMITYVLGQAPSTQLNKRPEANWIHWEPIHHSTIGNNIQWSLLTSFFSRAFSPLSVHTINPNISVTKRIDNRNHSTCSSFSDVNLFVTLSFFSSFGTESISPTIHFPGLKPCLRCHCKSSSEIYVHSSWRNLAYFHTADLNVLLNNLVFVVIVIVLLLLLYSPIYYHRLLPHRFSRARIHRSGQGRSQGEEGNPPPPETEKNYCR